MLNNKTTNIILLILIAACFVAGAILYPQLPQTIASHWNSVGEVDGFMSKFWGIFLLPFLLLVLYLIYLAIPKIDPMKANIASFRSYYNGLWFLIFLFLVYIYILSLFWNLGYRFNFATAIIPAFAIFWSVLGMLLKKSKRNWFVGIRTPWTLSSDIVWEKTHWLAGKLFELTAVVILIGLWFPNLLLWFIFIPIIATVLITIVYSFLEYRKLGK